MTPNTPVIAEEARKLLTGANSKLENDMLDMVSRLADVITYNAEAMNKLVRRVDELEKLTKTNDKPSSKPVIGYPLQVLLKNKHVHRVKCVKSESDMWKEGKAYDVLGLLGGRENRRLRSETGKLLSTSRSLFVPVTEQREQQFKQPFKLDFYGNTPREASFKDDAEQFFAITRMFMDLPTIHLIHPRSL